MEIADTKQAFAACLKAFEKAYGDNDTFKVGKSGKAVYYDTEPAIKDAN